uniref:Thioredoxin like 4A n=1 Tax=Oncorhynchus tshawytscha TaxID=74940 RepID=A0AAZ3PYS2_ONCTS
MSYTLTHLKKILVAQVPDHVFNTTSSKLLQWTACSHLCCPLFMKTEIFFLYSSRNKHIMIDLGTGNNNKINWTMEDKQEMIDIVETVYRGARKGRGLVVSPKDYSTKYRY